MTHALTLNVTQALQLAGLIPCAFIVLFLLSLWPRNRQAGVPILYFLSLACAFALPLLDLIDPEQQREWLRTGLLLGESTLAAFTFLLICQFLQGRTPPPLYWLVLAIPLVGGSSLLYAVVMQASDSCVAAQSCTDIGSVNTLYHIFSSSLVFLLLVFYASRAGDVAVEAEVRRHKYWLIVALILLHLLVLATDLARIAGRLTAGDALFAATMFRLTFIYLVLTSLFRVFYPALGQQVAGLVARPGYNKEADRPYAEKIRMLLEQEHAYRQMRLNRAKLAEMVGIGEHHLSRVVNQHFGKSFNELVNHYRIEEAKRRLREEATQVTVISFEVGFNSIASFNRVFRDVTGMSPTEYRNKQD